MKDDIIDSKVDMEKAIPTGICGLDKYIRGYARGKTTLIKGDAGTGKTIIAIHFINSACSLGENCVHIVTEEMKQEIFEQAMSFNMDFSTFEKEGKLQVYDLLPDRAQGKKLPDINTFIDGLDLPKGCNIILDNLGAFQNSSENAHEDRYQMDRLTYKLKKNGHTTILVCDEFDSDKVVDAISHSVHGVIRLFRRNNPFNDSRERIMDIIKMRNTPVPVSYIFYEIDEEGMKVR